MLVPDKDFLDHNLHCLICQHRLLKSSTIAIQRRHGHKNTLPFINLIASSTDYLSSLSSFSNYYDTTMDSIMVNYEANNLTDGTVKSILGHYIAS